MFFLVCRHCARKKCYQAHVMNLLLFLILESVSMIIVLICCKNMTIIFSKSVSNSLCVQIVSYCIGKKHLKKYFIRQCQIIFLWYIRSKSGRKLVLDVTVVYSRDLNLRTNYFFVSFCLYTWETRHSRHGIRKVWETWGYKFPSIHHFNSDIPMLHIDETPVKVGI